MPINDFELSKTLKKFADDITIKNVHWDLLRTRRDFVANVIQGYLPNDDYTYIGFFNMGSYETKTGVKYDDNDYDIDYGLIVQGPKNSNSFRLFKERLISKIRTAVKERYSRDVNVQNKKPVMAVRYKDSDSDPMFHLDIPVYIVDGGLLYHAKKNK